MPYCALSRLWVCLRYLPSPKAARRANRPRRSALCPRRCLSILPQDVPAEVAEEHPAPTEQQYEPIYEYINGGADDSYSTYEEPEHLNDLPEVSSSEVDIPKAVVIPDVAVSDASLFSGIVMWLCVALGIAVIVGVLVSKRTLRRGA